MALSFQEDLAEVLNRHSAESPSGTPDYILAEMLTEVLKTFNEAVGKRAEWRGETVELPALQRQTFIGVPVDDIVDAVRENTSAGSVVVNVYVTEKESNA